MLSYNRKSTLKKASRFCDPYERRLSTYRIYTENSVYKTLFYRVNATKFDILSYAADNALPFTELDISRVSLSDILKEE